MKLHKLFMMMGLLLGVSTLLKAQHTPKLCNINWPEFMSNQDLIWEKLPEHWYDAPFLGNGKLGLMIYREPGKNYL